MPIQRHRVDFESLPAETLDAWRTVAPAIAGDCMNRSNVMTARIKPLVPGTQLVGQARTVTSMVGDNSALHVAIGLLRPGEVLVADASGYADTAVWGGIMTRAAQECSIAGIVVDGAVRDAAEIRELGFPCFASAVVPAGPHKGFGGIIDGVISCAGCPVRPGDIVLGDDDGVAVVPLERQANILAASLDKIAAEEAINAETKEGNLPGNRMGLPEVEWID